VFHYIKVNLIKHLFSHHVRSVRNATTYVWPGQSGATYPYEIHSLEAVLKPLPGIYIYAKHLSDGDWSPIYISQTRDLHQRLEGHVTLREAIANGATHLHVHYGTAGPAARSTEEQDLIHRWRPVCNDVFTD
jgi:hypothetical protein